MITQSEIETAYAQAESRFTARHPELGERWMLRKVDNAWAFKTFVEDCAKISPQAEGRAREAGTVEEELVTGALLRVTESTLLTARAIEDAGTC